MYLIRKHIIDGDIIDFDTETTGLNTWKKDKPFAFSFANQAGETKYYEFDVEPFTRQPILGQDEMRALAGIKHLLEDKRIRKRGHNVKFDCRAVERAYAIKVAGPIDDSMIMAFCCNTLEPSLALKRLCKKYDAMGDEDQDELQKSTRRLRLKAKKLGWVLGHVEKPQPDGPSKIQAAVPADYWMGRTMAHLRPDIFKLFPENYATLCEQYAVKDAVRVTYMCEFYNQLMDELDTRHVYEHIEMELWPVIRSMEGYGVRTDADDLDQRLASCIEQINKLTPLIENDSWIGFDPKDPEQVRKLLYEKLQLPINRWTKGGKDGKKKKPAVDKFVIRENLSIPVVRNIAIWKANRTSYTSFYGKYKNLSIPDTVHDTDTILHGEYRQVGPATGRLSCANPNLQNVMTPENTSAVHPLQVRTAFTTRRGYKWLCVDYEGMEIRMFAACSQEPFMLSAIEEGRKIHDEMTNTIWGGEGNDHGLKQVYRILAFDGTGMHASSELDLLWRGWGITEDNVNRIDRDTKLRLANEWLALYDWNVVKAESAIKRKNLKTAIKTLSFLKIYGGRAKKAQLVLEGTRQEAQETLDLYDRLFPRVQGYFDELQEEGLLNGFITSKWGRRLAIDPDFAYRATNYMIQGSSADLMKRSMIRIHNWLLAMGIDAHVLMTIHDEVIVEVANAELTQDFVRQICAIMSDPEGHIPIDMTVEPKIVHWNWANKSKVTFDWTLPVKARMANG